MSLESTVDQPPDDDARVGEILQAWVARRELGNAEPAETLLENHPEHALRLRDCVETIELLGRSGLESPPEPVYPEIPDFEITGELGRGGMGIVYEARQVSLDRTVALKILPINTVDPTAAERFQREAETAAALHHTHIVPIHAVGRSDGIHWYAMQRIDGKSLGEMLRETPGGIDPDEVARIGIEAAEALALAHHHGVVHRDIKPANLLIQDDGHVWLTDFGLARRDADDGATVTGAMLGTPRYMSPEQVFAPKGVKLDHRTDIYSLGATLYELATGTALFDGKSALDVLHQIRTAEPAQPRDISRRIPRSMEIVLQKCLAKDPKERYQSAAELASDLRAVRDGNPIKAKGIPFWVTTYRRLLQYRKRIKQGAIAVAATAALYFLVSAWLSYRAQQSSGRFVVRTSGGSVSGTIHQVNERGVANPIALKSVTIPMPDSIELPAGDYKINLAEHGKPSRSAQFHVYGGDATQSRYRGQADRKSIPIDNASLWPIRADGNHDWIATFDKGQFQVFGESGTKMASIDVASITPSGPPDGDSWDQQFTYDPELEYQGNRAAVDSYFGRPERVMRSAVDLDGDHQHDFVITAQTEPALAAIGSDSSLLWARKLDLPAVENPKKHRRQPSPSVMQVVPIDDVDDDGNQDLLVNVSRSLFRSEVEPYIVTVSGRTGETIALAKLPVRKPDPNRPIMSWPSEGILFQSADHETRTYFPLSRSGSGTLHRGLGGLTKDIRYQSGFFGFNLPATPPLHLCRWGNRFVAVASTDRDLTAWDVATGKQVGDTTELPFSIACNPKPVSLGPNSPPAFWILSARSPQSLDASFKRQTAALMVLGESEPRWKKMFAFDWGYHTSSVERSDLPLCSDLDGDGVDEVIFPEYAENWLGHSGSVNCFRGDTGKPLWDQAVEIDFLERTVERAAVLRDFDGDGVRDIAAVSLSGRSGGLAPWELANHRAVNSSVIHSRQSFAVFVDLISGANGNRLGWTLSPINAPHDNIAVAEIDRLASDGDSIVEASVVVGDRLENQLQSLTVRFDLDRKDPPQTLIGLTRVGFRDSGIGGGYYLQRPGYDELFPRSVVWLDSADASSTIGPAKMRIDANRLISRWVDVEGNATMLVQKTDTMRMFAVDVASGQTIWTRVFPSTHLDATPVLDDQARAATILIHSDRRRTDPPELIDAQTGRRKWLLPGTWGRIENAYVTQQAGVGMIHVYGHQSYIPASGPANLRGMRLMQVRESSGQLVWQKEFLKGLFVSGGMQPPQMAIERIDCDGDEVLDFVVADDVGQKVALVAFSGVDGEQLWSVPTGLPSEQWLTDHPWPMMATCGTNEAQVLVFFDLKDKWNYSLKMIDAKRGEMIDESDLPYQSTRRTAVTMIGRQTDFFSLTRLDKNDPWPRFILKYPDGGNNSWSRTWRMFRATAKGFEMDVQPPKTTGNNTERWFHCDIDGDGKRERLVFNDDSFTCSTIEGAAVWRVGSGGWNPVGLFPSARSDFGREFPYLRVKKESGQRGVIDLRNGEIVWRGEAHVSEPPIRIGQVNQALVPTHTGVAFVDVSRDNVSWTSVGQTPKELIALEDTSVMPTRMDPRRRRRLPTSPIRDGQTPASFFGELLPPIVLVFFAIFLPLAYVLRLRRRFNLSFLMLGPVVATFSFLAWQKLYEPSVDVGRVHDSPAMVLIGGSYLLVCLWILVRFLQYGNRWILGAMLLFSGTMTAFAIGTPIVLNRLSANPVVYQFSAAEVAVSFLLVLAWILIMGSPVWWAMKWLIERRNRRLARVAT